MSELVHRSPKEQLESINRTIKSAYDLSSIGMGIQMHSLKKLSKLQVLPDWAMDAVQTPFSNFIAKTYVLRWGDPNHDVGWDPLVLCEETELHRKLYRSMKNQYDQLDVTKVPKSFPRHGISFPNPESMDDELLTYLQTMKTAAAHKLAFMLAISDQLTFEAKELGQPISKDYNPIKSDMKWQTDWKLIFGEDVPDFGLLYENGYSILKDVSIEDNSLYAHILKKPQLKQLA